MIEYIESFKKDISTSDQFAKEQANILVCFILIALVSMHLGFILEATITSIIRNKSMANPFVYLTETTSMVYRHSIVGKVFALLAAFPFLYLSNLYSMDKLGEKLTVLKDIPRLKYVFWLPVVLCLYKQIDAQYYPITGWFIASFVFYAGIVMYVIYEEKRVRD